MAHDGPSSLSDERYRESTLLPQDIDDVLFRTSCVGPTLERLLRDLPNGAHVPALLGSDDNV
jgi:hypothetical protein